MSYTLAYNGAEIDEILGRAATGGALDTAIAAKQDALTFDDAPTSGSDNPVKSSGIYDAIQAGGAAALAAFATDSVSGDVVSFPDGASNIPVKAFAGSILPQQNLNGQSAPYPAGGGANKVDQSTLTNTGVVSDTGATGTQTTRLFSALFPVTPNTTYYAGVDGKSSNNETIQFNRFIFFDSSKTFLSRSATGQSTTGVNITTPANAYYASIDLRTPALTTNLVAANVTKLWFAVGSGTVAYSPYSNICPVSGWTGCNIARLGKNLFNVNTSTVYRTDYARYSIDGANISAWTTTATSSSIRFLVCEITEKLVGKTVTISGTYTGDEPQASKFKLRACDNADLSGNGGTDVAPYSSPTATITSDLVGKYLAVCVYAPTSTGKTTVYHNIQVEFGTATAYEPYNGQTIVLSFGQTVYAGTLTALGGGKWQVQPTHALTTLSALSWSKTANGIFASALQARAKGQGIFPFISDTYKQYTGAHSTSSNIASLVAANGDGIYVNAGSASFYVADARYTDADAFKSDMGSVVFVYELATYPDPITITGEDLQTLLGANTVWTDVGSVTGMTYRADTALYIDKKLGA